MFCELFAAGSGQEFVCGFGQFAVAAFFAELAGEFVVFCAEALAVAFFANDNPDEERSTHQAAAELDDIGSLRDAEHGQSGGGGGLDIVGHSEVRFTIYEVRIGIEAGGARRLFFAIYYGDDVAGFAGEGVVEFMGGVYLRGGGLREVGAALLAGGECADDGSDDEAGAYFCPVGGDTEAGEPGGELAVGFLCFVFLCFVHGLFIRSKVLLFLPARCRNAHTPQQHLRTIPSPRQRALPCRL